MSKLRVCCFQKQISNRKNLHIVQEPCCLELLTFSVYADTENIHFVCPIGLLEAKFLHQSVREREGLVQGADKLLKLYYTSHRHDGLQKSLRNLGSMPTSYFAA
jgi:hypothetical protein